VELCPLLGSLLIYGAQGGANAQEQSKAGRICEMHKNAEMRFAI
jgi:hypothetical protein